MGDTPHPPDGTGHEAAGDREGRSRGKANISVKRLQPWDQYKAKPPDEALASIYAHAGETAKQVCDWYWKSIKAKRWTSFCVRALAFTLLVFATAMPILAGLSDDANARLRLTQIAVALLAIAGLTQVADRIFGWSNGWMRYVTTVTAMEQMTRTFELDWAKHLLQTGTPPTADDVKKLFDLAKALEEGLVKLQSDETEKWVSEFNAGMAVLDTLIKAQREATAKTIESVKAEVSTRQRAEEQEREAQKPGAVQVTLVHRGDAKKVEIALDSDDPREILGDSWARTNVAPGQHVVRVHTGEAAARREMSKVVVVKPGQIEQLTLDLSG